MDLGFESGFSDFDVDVEEVEVKKVKKYDRIWHIKEGGSIYQKPTIHEGVMYFGAMDSCVYAVDAESGKEIWRTKLEGPVMGSCPLVRGNVIYIGSYAYDFYALNRETGKIVWRFRTGGEVISTPAVWNDKIYFCSGDGYAYCLDLEGKPVWKFKTGDKVASSPAVAEGKVVFGSFDDNYYCLDAETGEELWRFKTGAEIWQVNPVLIKEGRVYCSSFDNHVYCLDLETGREIWRFKTGKYGNSSAPVYYKGLLYHGTRDGIMYCLTLEGKELWRFKCREAMDCGVGHEGMFLFVNGDGFLYALDAKTGKELWRFRTGTVNYHFPTVWEGKIYFSSWDCHIYAIDLEGKELWRFASSNLRESEIPPTYGAWKMEIKKSSTDEETIEDEKYREKKEESVSLSDYHVTSEYSTTSEYKQKSDYDTSFVMFEDVLEGEDIWTSDSRDLRPRSLTLR
ncbi:MAG: PQQ-binding-like beta-propeller repeat protein [Candidatus Aenigmarchaeota archaeon]|nr:PQQ-binding-like beta-propeller repeat protein [Candidatus Aenigmarchaeota archaeon]